MGETLTESLECRTQTVGHSPSPGPGKGPRQTPCHLCLAATSCQTLEREPRPSPGARAQLPQGTAPVCRRRPSAAPGAGAGSQVSLAAPQAKGLPSVLPGAASLVTVSGAKKGRKAQLFLLGCPGHGTVKSKAPRPRYRRGPSHHSQPHPEGCPLPPMPATPPAPWDGGMRTDGQPKGQPGPGGGRHRCA